MKIQLTLLFNIILVPFLLGQGIKQVAVEYYIAAPNQIIQQNFNTYYTLVLDKHQALKKERIKPNDIARNHLILKNLDKVTDSADLRIYLYVGAYKQLKVTPYTSKEKDPTTGLEIKMYYKEVHYQMPIYAQVYNCSGSLIWTAAAEQDKVYYFGEGFMNEKDLEATWNKNKTIQNRLAIEDGLIGQTNLWMKDLQKVIVPEKKVYKFSLLQPKNFREYRDFQDNVYLSKTFLKNLHTHTSHKAATKAAQEVITAWKALLPSLEKDGKKTYAAALYNLAFIYYSIDQLTEANEFALASVETGEHKYYNKELLREIEATSQHFKKTGANSRHIFTQCEEFKYIDPSSIQGEPVKITDHSILVQEESPSQTTIPRSPNALDLVADPNVVKKMFKRDKQLKDGMVFLNSGQLLQGQIKGKITNTKSLKKGVLFAPFRKDGTLGKEQKLKPSKIKKFVAKGKTYESNIVGTRLFKVIGERYFMEVLEEGEVKLLYFMPKKKVILRMMSMGFYNPQGILVKIPSQTRAKPLKKVNMYKLLKDAPPILKKYKAGAYGNKARKRKMKVSFFNTADKQNATRQIFQEYNSYMFKQKDKTNTGGFKMN